MREDESLADFTPGRVVELSPGLRRIVAPNAGPFPGPGTNSYLLGEEERILIDPGPDLADHVEALLQAGEGRIAWVLVTHTHADHSPAARAIRRATGATVVGALAPDDGRQDVRFRPDVQPVDGERILADGLALRCVATPGHASNHFCFLLEGEGILFTGDHILGHVSPVILPPDGSMADYLESLQRLKALPLAWIAPGHGPPLPDPVGVIDRLVDHRLGREARVMAALDRLGSSALEQLLPEVYADVDPTLHQLAICSLHAHLIKLERDGRVVQAAGSSWTLLTSRR
ncbi:MAG: MBL fold metallo-hydrolase [Steroidobacteraceae bacterium]